jgi:hypothetical protein
MSMLDRLMNLGKGFVAVKTRRGSEDERLEALLQEELAALGDQPRSEDPLAAARARAELNARKTGAAGRPGRDGTHPDTGGGGSTPHAGPVQRTLDGPEAELPDEPEPVRRTL